MKYLILEDEPLAAERLQQAISDEKPDWKCLGTLESVREAKREIPASEADLLFVDIHLADGLSFSIFEEISFEKPLIFTTAYDQYALKAFELNSINYLLKPVTKKDLRRALQKFENRTDSGVAVDWQSLVAKLKPEYKTRFLVSTGNKIKSLNADEVAFFFAQGKHSFVFTLEGKDYIFDQPLSKLIEQLDPQKFFQINRQFILSIDAISEMIPYSKGRLKIVTDPATPEEAIVSVDKSPTFKSWVGAS